jgi:hypothetical protein
VATLFPAVLIADLIVDNAVDMPSMDDWGIVSNTLIRARLGVLDWEYLFQQHNESRPLFPRLLFLVISLVARGDTRWLLVVSFVLACAVSYSVFSLGKSTLTTRAWPLWGMGVLANLLIFTPNATWLMGSYLGLVPIACLTVSAVVLRSDLGTAKRFALSGVLCLIGTFSYANGLTTWLLAAPIVACSLGRRWLGGWALAFLVSAGLYFQGYVRPGNHPPLLDGLDPLRLGHFVLVFWGGPLGLNRAPIAAGVGTLLIGLFAAVGLYLVAQWRRQELRRRVMPWLSIGAYAVLSGLTVGVGRSSWGVHIALANKYAAFSLYLAVALTFVVPIVLEDVRVRGLLSVRRLRVVYVLGVGCLAGCLILHAVSAGVGIQETVWTGRMLRYGKSCLLFINVHVDEACLSSAVFPDAGPLRSWANDLDRLGYLHPRLRSSPRLQDLSAYGATDRDVGVFDTFIPRRHKVVTGGWAGKPSAAGPADAVILARQEPGGGWTPIVFVPVLLPRPDVVRERGRAYRNPGWRQKLKKRDLPPLPFPIGAWAFDAERGWALPLQGVHRVEPAPPL